MQQGTILDAVRQENRSLILGVSVLCAVLLAVLGYNWKYLYNWAAGPFEFDAALAADPGPREFVRAEGPTLPTGLSEERTLRLFRGAVESTRTSANYLAMLAGDGLLMVKVEPEFSGGAVEGNWCLSPRRSAPSSFATPIPARPRRLSIRISSSNPPTGGMRTCSS